MNNIWIISDCHFGHTKIIELCNRPFSSVEEMDTELINNWNSVVDPDDTMYFLGDYTWYKDDREKGIFNALSGKKHLIKGNHDPKTTLNLPWESQQDYLEIIVDKKFMVLFHYPILDWRNKFRGSLHFHGHVHNTPIREEKNRFNVSVEMINYTPVNIRKFLK